MSLAVLGGLLLGAFMALCYWRILSRIGHTPWVALLVFVPFLGQIILLAWLAFGRWPLLDYMEARRQWASRNDDDMT